MIVPHRPSGSPAPQTARRRHSRSPSASRPTAASAIRVAAPTPVITPHPSSAARSNGIASGTRIALCAGTTQYSANPPRYISWCIGTPSHASLGRPSKWNALRPIGEELRTQDRLRAVAIEAVPTMRVPRQHHAIADRKVGDASADFDHLAGRLMPQHRRQLHAKAPSIASRSVWHRLAARMRTSTSPGATGPTSRPSIGHRRCGLPQHRGARIRHDEPLPARRIARR